jgi:hypothetical protein
MSLRDGSPGDDQAPWEGPADEQDDWQGSDDQWRGDTHLRDWPEELAGPEYWLFKNQRDE